MNKEEEMRGWKAPVTTCSKLMGLVFSKGIQLTIHLPIELSGLSSFLAYYVFAKELPGSKLLT
jgi:hypothetical protein